MNNTAVINDQTYTFLEEVSSLEEDAGFILCADEKGRKHICSERMWRSSAACAEQPAPIHTQFCSGEDRVLPLCVQRAGRPVRKAVLQQQDREKRIYACMQKRVDPQLV